MRRLNNLLNSVYLSYNLRMDIVSDNNKKEHINLIENKYDLERLAGYKLESAEYDIYDGLISQNNDYKISIVIPIYNNETLIHRTITSIENQSFNLNDIEVLMVNDASTDYTSRVINQYADMYSNFKAIHIRNRTGSAGTPRNIGLNLALADYIMFIDHDDFLEIDALEKLYKKILEYDCDLVYGTYVLINDRNIPIKFSYPAIKQGFFKSLENNKESITIPPSIWTKLFRKDFLLENNILFPTILGEDAIFMSKALKYANGIYYMAEDIVYYYNINENSYTTICSYNYFVEGFISEEYLFNLYDDWNQLEYYKLRGQGILNYYINRFMQSDLSNYDVVELMPLFFEFCNRLNLLNIEPNNERNNIVFNYILNNDTYGLIKFKNNSKSKIRIISKRILDKIKKYSFW